MLDTRNTEISLGALVAEDPARAGLLERFGLDFCCGGGRSVAAACAEAGLDPVIVLTLLRDAPAATKSAGPDIRALSLTELVDHIEATHHLYLKEELPRVTRLAAKVLAAHGGRHAELSELRQVVDGLAEELAAHLTKEETTLFPAVRALERSDRLAAFPFGSLAGPVGVMEVEHEAAGVALRRLRELSREYVAPADACESYRALYGALAELESDLHVHIHKENNVLFRRVRELGIPAPEGVQRRRSRALSVRVVRMESVSPRLGEGYEWPTHRERTMLS